jgi:hypothetical protein
LTDKGEVLHGSREHDQEKRWHNIVPDHTVPLWWPHCLRLSGTQDLSGSRHSKTKVNVVKDAFRIKGGSLDGKQLLGRLRRRK